MKQLNLQDVFLNQARREKITVTIYLTNGFQFKGVVRGFDSFTVTSHSFKFFPHSLRNLLPLQRRRLC